MKVCHRILNLLCVLGVLCGYNSVAGAEPPISHQSSDKDTPVVTGENSAGDFDVYGQSDHNSVAGETDNGHGVVGKSKTEHGVWGESERGSGVLAKSKDWHGVHGETHSTIGGAGVWGEHKSTGVGTVGKSVRGVGVWGESEHGTAVNAVAKDWHGVYGETHSTVGGAGVWGEHKSTGVGTVGKSDRGSGVLGESVGGVGVYGRSIEFDGVWGESQANGHSGVFGVNKKDGFGVFGRSEGKGVGVFGYSVGFEGVHGATESSECAGVAGLNKKHGHGIHGRSDGKGNGVYGTSSDGRGVMGDSRSHDGVLGMAHVAQKSGVVGLNDHAAGYGVWAASLRGTGLYAKGKTGAVIGSDKGVALRIVSDSAAMDESNSPLMEALAEGDLPVFSISKSGQVSAATFQTARPEIGEQIRLSEAAETGDVVEIDPDEPGTFRLSRESNSTSVVGVVVASPGIALGTEQSVSREPNYHLALLGRVPVKVSTENGPIHPGDLLAASSTPGRAMKAPTEPKPGTVVGKALGNLLHDQGVIEMLVMLR